MKRILGMFLFGIIIVIASFFVSSAICFFIFGFLWSVNKVSVFLGRLCIAWNLEISSTLLNMMAFSIVGAVIILIIIIFIYVLFFRKVLPDPEE